MKLFKKKEKNKYGKRIIVKSGENDIRSYPEPGSLFHVELTPDVEVSKGKKCQQES